MNRNVFIILLFILSYVHSYLPAQTIADSSGLQKENSAQKTAKSKPQKEKTEYVSQVTKYGFKNLFTYYHYNPAMPYTAQVNPNAEIFIRDYVRTHNSYLQKMKGWGQPYFNLIESILQQYGLPHELKYIAVIESNLKTGALSNKGAYGPWQFMPETAKRLGLKINNYVDERTDYYKSTHAAAKYLLSLYEQFHDWLLVMAAYNGGSGKVNNAIAKSKSRDFWKLQYYLPEESRNYVKRFIATHYIMEGNGVVIANSVSSFDSLNNEQLVSRTDYVPGGGPNPYNHNYNIQNSDSSQIQVMSISGKYMSSVIAKNLSMEISEFNRYNPDFTKVISATGNYDLRLPSDKMQLFVTNKYQILNESVQVLLGSLNLPNSKTIYRGNKKLN